MLLTIADIFHSGKSCQIEIVLIMEMQHTHLAIRIIFNWVSSALNWLIILNPSSKEKHGTWLSLEGVKAQEFYWEVSTRVL